MARQHLRMGVPHFIDRDFEELANAKGLQVWLLGRAGQM
jgi:cytochrome c oxidase assembly protein Cox11